jgi:type IV pilus biogenesis protein CpaD/CtpE
VNAQKTLSAAGIALATLLAGACANEPTLTERNFGDSVREMINAQTYDPSTLSAPSTEPVEGSDGRRSENVLEVYRTDIAKPEVVRDEIVLSVGGGQR